MPETNADARPLVLVVDDESAMHAIITDTLEDDYRLVSAVNGRDGVAHALKIKPDIILMDMMMPDMGGYEAVRLLYKDPSTRNIPVIVITAQNFDDKTILLIKREPNVAEFLPKPFRPKILRSTLQAVLERTKGKSA